MPKLKHDCVQSGCWLVKHHVSIEIFDECCPGRVAGGDLDGVWERDGYLLKLENKAYGSCLPRGQERMFEQVHSRSGGCVTYFVVYGKPDFTGLLEWERWQQGTRYPREAVTLDRLKDFVRRWFDWVDRGGGPA